MCEEEVVPTPEPERPSLEDYGNWSVETDINDLQALDPKSIPELESGESIYLLHPEEEVLERVEEIARQISYDYKEVENLAVLIIMNGGRRYAEKLLSHLSHLKPQVAYVDLKSYTNENTQGEVLQLSDIYKIEIGPDGEEIKVDMTDEEIIGYKWLGADDVLDTHATIHEARSILKSKGVNPEDIRTTTLCNKNYPNLSNYNGFITYHGFWLVGANMGSGDRFTTLPTGPMSIGVYTEN